LKRLREWPRSADRRGGLRIKKRGGGKPISKGEGRTIKKGK